MREIEPYGLYIISDQYFTDFPNDRYMDNKSESRPHYYAIQDKDGVFWMIPLSTKVEKYRAKIDETEEKHGTGSCFMYMIAEIHGQDRALLICDMFPVTEKYIVRPYTISGLAYVVRNEAIKKAVNTKAKRYLSMVKRGQLRSPLNILQTKENLLKRSKPRMRQHPEHKESRLSAPTPRRQAYMKPKSPNQGTTMPFYFIIIGPWCQPKKGEYHGTKSGSRHRHDPQENHYEERQTI